MGRRLSTNLGCGDLPQIAMGKVLGTMGWDISAAGGRRGGQEGSPRGNPDA